MDWSHRCTCVASVTPSRRSLMQVVVGATVTLTFALFVRAPALHAQQTDPFPATEPTYNSIIEGAFAVAHLDDFEGDAYAHSYLLFTDDGAQIRLDIDESLIAEAGGSAQLDGLRVRVGFAPMSAAEGLHGGDTVVSLELLTPDSAAPVESATTAEEAGSKSLRILNLLCRFPDVAAEPPAAEVMARWFDDATAAFPSYFDYVSYGALDLRFTTASHWATLPVTFAAFPRPLSIAKALAMGQTVAEGCLQSHGGSEILANYDGVQFFTNADWGSAFVTRIVAKDSNGAVRNLPAAWYSYFWGTAYPHSIIAHEIGHMLGARHSNNSDGDGNPYDNDWDVMSGDPCMATVALPGTPPSCLAQEFIAPQKLALGWLPPARVFMLDSGVEALIDLDWLDTRLPGGYSAVQVPLGASPAEGYISIEARSAKSKAYDRALKATGVIIHEVLSAREQPAWQVGANSDVASSSGGGLWEVGETYTHPRAGFSITVIDALPTGFRLFLRRPAAIEPVPVAPPKLAAEILPAAYTWNTNSIAPIFRLANLGGPALHVTYQITLPVGVRVDNLAIAAGAEVTASDLQEVDSRAIQCHVTARGALCMLPNMGAQTVLHLRPALRATAQLAAGRYAIQARVFYSSGNSESATLQSSTQIPFCVGFCTPRQGATLFLPAVRSAP